MNIVMITDNDPAGMGIAFCNAINRYSNHTCRLITTQELFTEAEGIMTAASKEKGSKMLI